MPNVIFQAFLWASLCGCAFTNPAPDRTIDVRSVPSQPGCPSPVSVVNPGFEAGTAAHWETDPATKTHIVNPGFNNSRYALQIDALASNYTNYGVVADMNGYVCCGYYYNVSYSVNWINYTGPEGPPPKGSTRGSCYFSVGVDYTARADYTPKDEFPYPLHWATRIAGWHHYSYLARAVWRSGYPGMGAGVTCNGGGDGTQILPAFSIRIDDMRAFATQRSPNPPPTFGYCSG